MGNLISYNQRMCLRNSLQNDLLRFFREKKGYYTFTEFLDFKSKLREGAVKRYATEKNPNRIPDYMWNEFNGFFSALMELNYDEVEGGYMVFGRFYRHPDRKTYFQESPTWQDLCKDDASFRQKLLQDSYVHIWKNTGMVYSENNVPKFPSMAFYKEGPKNFRFDIVPEHNKHTITGSEPFQSKTMIYKRVMELMKIYGVPMQNVEEL